MILRKWIAWFGISITLVSCDAAIDQRLLDACMNTGNTKAMCTCYYGAAQRVLKPASYALLSKSIIDRAEVTDPNASIESVNAGVGMMIFLSEIELSERVAYDQLISTEADRCGIGEEHTYRIW